MGHTQPPTQRVLKELSQGVTRLGSKDHNSPHLAPRVRMVGDYTPNFHVASQSEQRCNTFPLDNWRLYVMYPQRRHMTSSNCLLLNVKPKKGVYFVLCSTNTYIYSKKNLLAGLSVTKMYDNTTLSNLRKVALVPVPTSEVCRSRDCHYLFQKNWIYINCGGSFGKISFYGYNECTC
jgi:hypothetical protein